MTMSEIGIGKAETPLRERAVAGRPVGDVRAHDRP